jgi:hypothetical protein
VQPLNCGPCPADALPSKPVNPLTVERITRAALAIVDESGYAGVSMCTVAERLDTGQVSLPERPLIGAGSGGRSARDDRRPGIQWVYLNDASRMA